MDKLRKLKAAKYAELESLQRMDFGHSKTEPKDTSLCSSRDNWNKPGDTSSALEAGIAKLEAMQGRAIEHPKTENNSEPPKKATESTNDAEEAAEADFTSSELLIFLASLGFIVAAMFFVVINAEKWWDDFCEFVSDIRTFLKMRHECKNIEEEAKKRERVQRYMDFSKSGGNTGR